MPKLNLRPALERALDMSEPERIASVLRSCANKLDNEPRFLSGTSVRQALYNMATAVLVLERPTVCLKEERFYKLGVMLTKVVQEAHRLEGVLDALDY